ncbi:peptidase [Pedobacter sp.]|uniref:peptidase n=1 Tax=Pedobacter sp. TaxID=1411316 RepID=UPI00396CA53C
MSKKSFVLNDETQVNSYGFRVPNALIDLDRFKENAVLLYMHKRGEVHGRWENIRIEGSLLLADPVFDEADPDSAKIAGKVKRGFLKGASIYLNFTNNTTFFEAPDKVLELHNSEAFEASVVDIPSNKKSVKLFADGKELNEKEIKGIMLSAPSIHNKSETEDKNQKTEVMEKFKLTAPAIAVLVGAGLAAGETESEVNDAIIKLGAALTAEKTAHNLEKNQREALQKEINDSKAAALTALVDQAVTDGKILATAKESFIALGHDAAKAIIDNLPGKVQLGSQVNNQAGGANPTDPKTLDEFEKLTNEAKLAFKNNNPTGYTALFA